MYARWLADDPKTVSSPKPKRNQPHIRGADSFLGSGSVLLSRAVSSQVPSALKGLTSVFGMGTGGSPLPLPPEFSRVLSLRFPRDFLSLAPLRSLTLKTAHPAFKHLAPSSTNLLSVGLAPSSLDQVLDRLVSPSSICYQTSTGDLSPGSPPGVLLLSNGTLILEVGFTLRCLQRLSHPHFASLLCRWHDNSCTSGASTPVLSY